MSEGARFERWNHTASLMARIHNSLAVSGKTVQAWEFHPYLSAGPSDQQPGQITDLKIFLPK